MQGGIDFPLQFGNPMGPEFRRMYQIVGELVRLLVSNMDPWERLTGVSMEGHPLVHFRRRLVAFVALLLHGTLSTPGIWVGN